jgi:putative SOS response-associated peptidase YedK
VLRCSTHPQTRSATSRRFAARGRPAVDASSWIDGFSEWCKKGGKQSFAIPPTNDQLTVMARLWEEWKSPAGETIKSCTVITTESNELIEPLHDRMPVILAEEEWPAWLGEVPATDITGPPCRHRR